MNEEKIAKLQALSEVASRVSHATRTHLGVGISAFDDLINGVELNQEDLKDGLGSLKKILETIDSLKIFVQNKKIELTSTTVEELIKSLLSSKLGSSIKINSTDILNTENLNLAQKLNVSNELLFTAIQSLASYFGPLESSAELNFNLDKNKLSLSLSNVSFSELDNETIESLIEKDQSPKTLALLFAKEVFELHAASYYFDAKKSLALIDIPLA